ncbi:MAG: hypothetical protein LQ350_005079 [Teloschistes chrysophthalmus]|nr:MAG: hypothetical protein LQ350_005079 [Niorma chrysophthalma]
MKLLPSLAGLGLILSRCTLAITVAEITGDRYLSPSWAGSDIFNLTGFTNLTGLITFIGYWTSIRSLTPDDDERTSKSIGILSFPFGWDLKVGDIVTIDGDVWANDRPWSAFLPGEQITSPHNVRLVSRGNPVEPVILGGSTSGIIGNKDMRPPTQQYNRLDNGNVFGVPNKVASVTEINPRLEPRKYGMDFFHSLNAELVTIKNATALGRRVTDHTNPRHSGPHFWVYGDWPVTGRNARGGLTVRDGDGNPETLILFDPVDGTRNPDTKLGDSLTDITGVIEYEFGLYYIRPTTAPKIKAYLSPSLPSPSTIKSNGKCNALTVAEYNLEFLAPGDSRIPLIVDHIATYLNAPTIIFLQGVEDSSGPANDGTVDANITLSGLTQTLKERTGIPYEFIDIDPMNNADGPDIGSNIRSAYLFNPLEVRLHNPNPGNSSVANAVLPGSPPSLRFNPGRIDAPPTFEFCRKPLAAHWETIDHQGTFFTVNVHWTDKSALVTLDSDSRPPRNPWLSRRNGQANVTGSFIAQILAQDKNAAVIVAGNFNEYLFVEPMKRFVNITGLQSLDVVTGVPELERYTSSSGSFAYGSQDQLTHMFVSPSIARHVGEADLEHVHVNTWAGMEDAAGVYDPSTARLNVCVR